MTPYRTQIEGREFDWFAVDSAGDVAHFSTAGYGPVPIEVLQRLAEADALPDQILKLPVICVAEGHLNGKIDDWLEMARRGLYSFDWSPPKGYIRAATPSLALNASSLPAPLLAEAPIAKFGEAVFSELPEFDPRSHCACE